MTNRKLATSFGKNEFLEPVHRLPKPHSECTLDHLNTVTEQLARLRTLILLATNIEQIDFVRTRLPGFESDMRKSVTVSQEATAMTRLATSTLEPLTGFQKRARSKFRYQEQERTYIPSYRPPPVYYSPPRPAGRSLACLHNPCSSIDSTNNVRAWQFQHVLFLTSTIDGEQGGRLTIADQQR